MRVVPKSVGHHPGLDGPFTIMTLTEPQMEVAYVGLPDGGRLAWISSEVASCALRYVEITQRALPEAPSRDLIRQIMEAAG